MHVTFWQIQFPALDIRLSYNDIQLFLAITKSIPTTSTSLPSDNDLNTAASSELSATSKDNFGQKTKFLLGMLTPMYDAMLVFCFRACN